MFWADLAMCFESFDRLGLLRAKLKAIRFNFLRAAWQRPVAPRRGIGYFCLQFKLCGGIEAYAMMNGCLE